MIKKVLMMLMVCISLVSFRNINAQEVVKIEDGKNRVIEITKYIKTKTLYNKYTKEIIQTEEEEMSKEEYDRLDYVTETQESCNTWCYETDYKALRLRIEQEKPKLGYGTITVTNTWKKVPSVKSYDIIAVTYNMSTIGYASITSAKYNDDKLSLSNQKIDYNGVGLSVKLPSSMKDDDTISLEIVGTFGTNHPEYWNSVRICSTYQHAQSNVSVSDSLAYSFSRASGGVGSTLNFNSTSIRDKYDQMRGVCHG